MMNVPNRAAAEGVPMAPEPIVLTIDPAELGRMKPHDLKALGSAMRTLLDVSNGLCSQAKFMQETHYNTAAGEVVNAIADHLGEVLGAIYDAAKACQAETVREIEDRAWCVLDMEAERGDSLFRLAVTAAEAVRDLHDAEFRASPAVPLPVR